MLITADDTDHVHQGVPFSVNSFITIPAAQLGFLWTPNFNGHKLIRRFNNYFHPNGRGHSADGEGCL